MSVAFPTLSDPTYRIESELGSGGGGVVYKAWHTRLQKHVVIKELKRGSQNDIETQRNEVEALKNVKSQYIPQVFDFLTEGDRIYTVMDFIEGESLDKLLIRGQKFTQPQVLKWYGQLVSALEAIHKQNVCHRDIKPANIMLMPNGDVCLIDFNAALVSGNDVRLISRSLGYASPEQYEIYEHYRKTRASSPINLGVSGIKTRPANVTQTEFVDADKTEFVDDTQQTEFVDDVSDVDKTEYIAPMDTYGIDWMRSDIYSLGATMYHLLSGKQPSERAREVEAVSRLVSRSKGIADIIDKSMRFQPKERYATAAELNKALHSLQKRRIRIITTAIIAFSIILAVGALMAVRNFRLAEQEQRQIAEAALILEEEQRQIADEQRQLAEFNEARVLAEFSANAFRDGDVYAAVQYALLSLSNAHTAEGQRALADALGVYNLSDGFRSHRTVELSSSPLHMAISPDGNTAAVIYASAMAIFSTYSAEILATLPARGSALAEARFLNNNVIIFAGEAGITAYDISSRSELWTGRPATAISIAADGRSVVAIYRNEDFATVYDTSTGNILHEISFDGRYQRVTVNDIFANPGDNLFAINRDGTMLGVSFADGSLWVFDLLDRNGDIELFDNTSGFTRFTGGFHQEFFAFSASSPSESLFSVIDTIEQVQTGGFDSRNPFVVQADERGIFVQTENIVVNIHPITGEQTPLVTTFERVTEFAHGETHTLITTRDEFMFFDTNATLVASHGKEHGSKFLQLLAGTALIGSLDSPVIRIMRHESHPSANVFSYDPSYRHDQARISADWQTVMLFSFRGFRLYDITGALIAEREMQNATHIHDQLFFRDEDGCRLKVIYNDGTIRMYSAIDGSLISESTGELPDLTLFEVFYTDTLRITSPLHGVPRVYCITTGEFVRELERDAFLTYVTQIGEYTLTEYITGDGYRFGLLLNNDLEAIAYLPHLSDFVGDYLIFNYSTGNLRKSRIYNIYELIELARNH